MSNFAEEFKSLQDNEVIDTFALDKEKAHNLQGKEKSAYSKIVNKTKLFFRCL